MQRRTSENLLKTIECISPPPEGLWVVACSGGADSMALALLLAEYVDKTGAKLLAVTVDHGLREDSAPEAAQVGKWLAKRGIAHEVLTWKGRKPRSNLQEAARKARYRLLTEYCQRLGASHLFVAHTQEDQAETFLLRLARGSGVDGLACMLPVSTMHGIALVRPLLNVSKADLLTYLRHKKQKFICDPSNENARFDRVKFRKALPMLAGLGLTVSRLASTAASMQRVRECLEAETGRVISGHVTWFPEGYALVKWFDVPDEIALRIWATLIMRIGGHAVKPRLEETSQLYHALQRPYFKGATLGGCQFIPHKGKIIACRELGAVQEPVPARASQWDRFTILCDAEDGCTVGALTQAGWLALAKQHTLCNTYPSKQILYTLPALRDASGRVLAVPHLGVNNAAIAAEFTAQAFPLSA